MDVRVGLWRKLSAKELMLLNCGAEDPWESLGLQGDPTSPFWRRSPLGFLWKEWCYSWNSSILATSRKELTHWKRLWCWEGLGAGGEGDNRGWDGWMASLTRWMWVWVNSGSWWWTGRPERREAKSKGENERYKHLNAEFQRIARRDKKAFLSDQCKEIEEKNRMGKIRDLFNKLKTPREHFMQRWAR